MIKVFLSHSSKDKKFIYEIAELIGRDFAIIDEFEFEPTKPIESEIQKSLDYTNIFVYLASKDSLESEWCRQELESARDLQDQGRLVVCAFMIDKTISIDQLADTVKPWIKKQLIKTYTSAPLLSRAIRKRIYEAIWVSHPSALPRLRTFAGRAFEMSEIENLLLKDNLSNTRALVISGFNNVGRKAILRKVIIDITQKKYHPSYEPIYVSLDDSCSLDILISQLNNIVKRYKNEEIISISKSQSKSREAAVYLLNCIADSNEAIIISDNKCIVTPQGKFEDWFIDLINSASLSNMIHFYIASRICPKNAELSKHKTIKAYALSPMSLDKETLLFNDYCHALGNDVSTKESRPLLEQLSGYPEQVLTLSDIIKENGIALAEKQIPEIKSAYNTDVINTLNIFRDNNNALKLLVIMTKTGYASFSLLNRFYKEPDFLDLMAEFNKYGMYECFGPNKEFVLLNAQLSDYISRNISLKRDDLVQYRKTASEIIEEDKKNSEDLASFFYCIRTQIKDPRFNLSENYLIPSVMFKAIVELYYENKYKGVISLANRLLYDKNNSFYLSFESRIRYWLCLAYCKLGKEREFFEEIKNFQGYTYFFLKGFFFRCKKDYKPALENYEKALSMSKGIEFAYVAKAKHEKVITLMRMENFVDALPLAKENYNNDKKNTYHLDAYFRCYVRSKNPDRSILEDLIKSLDNSFDQRKYLFVPTFECELKYRLDHEINDTINSLEKIIDSNSLTDSNYAVELYKEVCSKNGQLKRCDEFILKHLKK